MFPSIQYSSANVSWFEQLVAPLLQSGTTKPLQRRSMQQLKKHVFSYIWGGLQWKHTKQQWSADCSCHFDLQPFDSQGYSLTLSGQLRSKKKRADNQWTESYDFCDMLTCVTKNEHASQLQRNVIIGGNCTSRHYSLLIRWCFYVFHF